MGFFGDLVGGIKDAVSGVVGGAADAVSSAAQFVGDNPWVAAAALPFAPELGALGGAADAGAAGLGAADAAAGGMDMLGSGSGLMDAFGFGGATDAAAGGLGALAGDGLGGGLDQMGSGSGLMDAFGLGSGGGGAAGGVGAGLGDLGMDPITQMSLAGGGDSTSMIGSLWDKIKNLPTSQQARLLQGVLGGIGTLTHAGEAIYHPMTMPRAPTMMAANRWYDPTTHNFSGEMYNPAGQNTGPGTPYDPRRADGYAGPLPPPPGTNSNNFPNDFIRPGYTGNGHFAQGGRVGGLQALQAPSAKAIQALRSRYRSAREAAADMNNPGSVASQVAQGPDDPIIQQAFAYQQPQQQQQGYARGGMISDGMSDSIPATINNRAPAKLSEGEYVVPADVVSHLGNGSTKAGSKHMDDMVSRIRQARTGRTSQAPQINAQRFLQ